MEQNQPTNDNGVVSPAIDWQIGKAMNGKRVHFHHDGYARCNKETLVLDDDKLSGKDIDCPKCQKYSLYKELVPEASKDKPTKEKPPTKKKAPPAKKPKTKKKEPPKKKKKTKAQLAKEKKAKEDKKAVKKIMDTPDKKVPVAPKKKKVKSKKKPPERATGRKKVEDRDVVIREGIDWYLIPKVIGRGESMLVYHEPSEKILFENIPKEVAILSIIKLNRMDNRWARGEKLPEGFVTEARQCVADCFSFIGKTVPENLFDPSRKDKIAEKAKPVRKISRRKTKAEEKPKRKIKRRTVYHKKITRRDQRKEMKKKKTRKLGFKKDGPSMTIVQELQKSNGSSLTEIVESVMVKHHLDKKKATSRVRSTIRKLVRKKGQVITIVMGGPEEQDLYKMHILD
ncbi:hypothetical protein AYK24_06670 [Thermoplasmatales archaeon SG8-52-4]|nr:MAG: hypothetical protein AYK24_06670 [Thermoplasmatales archaeon SG8-52-4]